MNELQSVVIVGAGHAGFQAAIALRQVNYRGRVVLINGEDHLPYQRPPLSKVFLRDESEPASVAFRPPSFFDDQKIEVVAASASSIELAKRIVALSSGEGLEYGHLVLALGARNRLLALPEPAIDVFYLRSLSDARLLRARMANSENVVVIGGGFIGLEFAVAARARGLGVVVVELGTRLMERAVSPAMSDYFLRRHQAAGIDFRFSRSVTSTRQRDGRLAGVGLSDGSDVEADMIVVGIGVLPNSELAEEAGLRTSPLGIVVDRHLVTSDHNISAIGDCACFPNPPFPGLLRLESVQNATDQARCLAARLAGQPKMYDSVPWFWSDQGGAKLQIVGLGSGSEQHVVRGDPEAGSFSIFSYRNSRLVAIESVNRASDHMIGRKIFAAGYSLAPEQAADATFDLRSLEV